MNIPSFRPAHFAGPPPPPSSKNHTPMTDAEIETEMRLVHDAALRASGYHDPVRRQAKIDRDIPKVLQDRPITPPISDKLFFELWERYINKK